MNAAQQVRARSDPTTNMLHLLRSMLTIRYTEERILDLFAQGKLYGTTHTCIGQEADAVGVISHLRDGDLIFSNHRCHGHYLARFDDVFGLVAELMGKEDGVCGGVAGSQHLCRDGFFSNGIQGGILPVAVGMAVAERVKKSDAVTVVFIGDGTLGEGAAYEAMNIASLWKAPILFVIEDNAYAQSTPSRLQIAGAITDRPASFGIETMAIETTDVEKVLQAAGPMIGAVRADDGPRALVIHTYRLAPHSKGDDHRDPEEIKKRRELDPIALLEQRLDPSDVERVRNECRSRVDAAITQASSSVDRMPERPVALPA